MNKNINKNIKHFPPKNAKLSKLCNNLQIEHNYVTD